MASVGINTVCLSLGYWHIGTGGDRDWMQDTMYAAVQDQYEGAWPRVLQSISWVAKYGIGVLIDLHGAPGSQNSTSLFSPFLTCFLPPCRMRPFWRVGWPSQPVLFTRQYAQDEFGASILGQNPH
jgi:hypothetical protein